MISYNDEVNLICEIGLVSNPTISVASTVWTDVSDKLENWKTKEGKQHELNRFEASVGTFQFDNRNGFFDPINTPNLKIDRRIRLRAVTNSVTFDIFNGFIKKISQVYTTKMANAGHASTVIEAVDGFNPLADTELPDSVFAFEILKTIKDNALTTALWYRLGDASDRDIAVNNGPTGSKDDGVYQGAERNQASLVALSDNGSAKFTMRSPEEGRSDRVQISKVITGYPFTVEFLAKLPNANNQLNFIVAGASGSGTSVQLSPGFIIFFNGNVSDPNASIVVYIDDGTNIRRTESTGYNFESNLVDVPADTTVHVVINVQAANQDARIWIDGFRVSASVTTQGTGAPVIPVTGITWFIGPTFNSTLQPDPYFIDEVVIYPGFNLSEARTREHARAAMSRTVTIEGIPAIPTITLGPWSGDTPKQRIERILDFAKWPITDRELDIGTGTLQATTLGGTALTYFQKIEETELGAFYQKPDGKLRFASRNTLFTAARHSQIQAIFGDGPNELPYIELANPVLDDTQILNDATVGRARGPERHIEDLVSIDEHFRQRFTATDLLHASDAISEDYANFIVTNFRQPTERTSGFEVDIDEHNFDIVAGILNRQLLDRILLNRRPPGNFLKSQKSQILSIEHISTAGPRRWMTVYELTPIGNVVDTFWLLGVVGRSELGQTTVLGF